VKLETRTCDCGCGSTYRCLPTSTARYAGQDHERRALDNGMAIYRRRIAGARGRPSKKAIAARQEVIEDEFGYVE
jgi:hypothetical protein